jgi:hypothetical protein
MPGRRTMKNQQQPMKLKENKKPGSNYKLKTRKELQKGGHGLGIDVFETPSQSLSNGRENMNIVP